MKDIKIKSIEAKAVQPEVSSPGRAKKVVAQKHRHVFLVSVVIILSLFLGAAGGILGEKLILPFLATLPRFQDNDFFKLKDSTVIIQKTEVIKTEENENLVLAIKKSNSAVVSVFGERDLENIAPNYQMLKGGGSGFVIAADGLIVTNRQQVADLSQTYFVRLASGEKHEVKSIIEDPLLDIAYLLIEADNLPVLELASTRDLKAGDQIFSLSQNWPEGEKLVSTGIINAINQQVVTPSKIIPDAIRADIDLSARGSGGPLVNLQGQVVGLNVYFEDKGEKYSYSLPAEDLKNSYQLATKANEIDRPLLGLNYLDLTPETAVFNGLAAKYGALVYAPSGKSIFQENSPAAKVGFKENDIIIKVNNTKIDASNSFSTLFLTLKPNEEVKLTVQRENQEIIMTVKPDELKSDSRKPKQR